MVVPVLVVDQYRTSTVFIPKEKNKKQAVQLLTHHSLSLTTYERQSNTKNIIVLFLLKGFLCPLYRKGDVSQEK